MVAGLRLILAMHQLLDYELVADGVSLVYDCTDGRIRFELEVVAGNLLLLNIPPFDAMNLECSSTIF